MLKIIFTWWLLSLPISAYASSLAIGQFSKGELHNWKEKVFDGKTQYTIIHDPHIQQTVLQAISRHAASGLFYEKRIDLEQTPYLNWSWNTSSSFQGLNENKKSGDDFVARIYVVIDGGVFFWNTVALNYVWSSSHALGEHWLNPYTSHATMVAVESGKEHLGIWRHYKRNVSEDVNQLLGKDTRYIDAIAIMTDTDNSGASATTLFGDIFFTSK